MTPHFDGTFTSGCNGYRLGYKREQNPFPVWSDKFIDWDAGWRFEERVFPTSFSPPPAPTPQPPPLPVSYAMTEYDLSVLRGGLIIAEGAFELASESLTRAAKQITLIRSTLKDKTGS